MKRSLILFGAVVVAACSSPGAAVRTSRPPQPRGVNVPGTPEPERLSALADLDPVWVTRTQLAGMNNGKRMFARNRMLGITGASTRENSRPIVLLLGDRSGSQGLDTDRDGITDAAELIIGSDPNNFDTDGDTIPDGFEIFGTGTLPTRADSDGDGTPDNVELDLDDPTIYADTDGDGLMDGQERASFATDPTSIDSDGDGFGDDLEFRFGTAMNDPNDLDEDADGDGEPDDFEMANGTDPMSADSDASDIDGDDLPDWLDEDTLEAARVQGRRSAIPAGSVRVGDGNV